MKNKIITLVKYFKFLYYIYYYIMSGFISFLKFFVKPDNNLILFNSFGGKKYDDSPKVIYEKMLNDKRFDKYTFVWAFHDPSNKKVKGARIIKTDSLSYYITALKARCWITNSGIERGLNFKGKKTFYFNTWHGTPIKKMGTDIDDDNKSFGAKKQAEFDIMCSQGDYETNIFSRVFNISKESFLCSGLPRNDKLLNYKESDCIKIKKKLGLPLDKKIILYAPTFREYERDNEKNCILLPPMNLNKWKNESGNEYCLLFRAHYEVSKMMEFDENGFVFNMSDYPALDDLMIISDILISDYSSIFFDFSIMDKLMFHFTYDYEKYSLNRGMYFDIRNKLYGSNNEDELISIIKSSDKDISKTISFRKKYVNYYGNAAEKSLDCIYKNIRR